MPETQREAHYYMWLKEFEGRHRILASLEVMHRKESLVLWVHGTNVIRSKIRRRMAEFNHEGRFQNSEVERRPNAKHNQYLITYQYRGEDFWKDLVPILNGLVGVEGVEHPTPGTKAYEEFKKRMKLFI
jgi:hypothetical protein